ncbi:cobalamin biosynthesis protein [Devosia lacusdianchii]|uniref:cobalamin biosynthesis protein n=1 Tax=Devosia lacusdianchii TaxID=2917991 RepID=UPI001F06A840|nr:cobalamin biosynthesis protein [Devosia sp. JXJ CY 41]
MTASFEHAAKRATPLVIGIGCATAASVAEIIALVDTCLLGAGYRPADVVAIASHIRKEHSSALARVAVHFGVPLRLLDDDDLAPGVPGTAEAVAAAAGPLRQGKRKSRYATCAIALCGPAFDLSTFGQAPRPRASMAASMVATSSAGP